MTYLLDNFEQAEVACFGTRWLIFSDQVMGGCSEGQGVWHPELPGLQLCGNVSLENAGGFIQALLPLVHSRHLFDARHFSGVHLRGQSQLAGSYFVYLRSKELSMPWQHYRVRLPISSEMQSYQLPFSYFEPFSTNHALNLAYLTQISVVAADFKGPADLLLSEIGFY